MLKKILILMMMLIIATAWPDFLKAEQGKNIFMKNETKLWQKIKDRDKPDSTIKVFKYIENVPIIKVSKVTTPQSTALANIIYFLSGKYYFFSEHGKEAFWNQIIAMVEESGKKFEELPERTQAKLYDKFVEIVGKKEEEKEKARSEIEMAIYSDGVLYSYIIGKHIDRSKSIENVAKGLKNFAESKGYKVDVIIEKAPLFETYKKYIDKGNPVLIKIKEDIFLTGTGYLIDGSGTYIIIHDPLSAEVKSVPAINLLSEADRKSNSDICKFAREFLSKMPPDEENFKGTLKGEIPAGVHFCKFSEISDQLTLLAMTKWTLIMDDFRNIMEKEGKREDKQ